MDLHVSEIFHSLQGEAARAGLPCVFVRLVGCNLRCRWCDTEYAFQGGQRMSVEAVEGAVAGFGCRLVEITGGEPLLQAGAVAELANHLLEGGYTVMCETSGERDVAVLPAAVIRIVDVKCPGSGEGGSFRVSNLEHLGAGDELKFVISDRADYDFAVAFVREHGLDTSPGRRTPALLFSPAFRQDAAGERSTSQCRLDPAELAQWLLTDRLEARLSLQVHKFIWDPAQRGV